MRGWEDQGEVVCGGDRGSVIEEGEGEFGPQRVMQSKGGAVSKSEGSTLAAAQERSKTMRLGEETQNVFQKGVAGELRDAFYHV